MMFQPGDAVRMQFVGVGRVESKDGDGSYTVAAFSFKKGFQGNYCHVVAGDMKPATPSETAKLVKLEAELVQLRLDAKAAAAEYDVMLDQLAKEPRPDLEPASDDESPFLESMFGAVGAKEASDQMAALRFEDDMAMQTETTSGYRGLKRTNYVPGERVKPRTDGNPKVVRKHCALNDGTLAKGGTVVEGNGMAEMFPRSPGQPRGIAVAWDDLDDDEHPWRLCYVTELEPE